VGKEFGHEMRMLVIHSKETTFTIPSLAATATKQEELMWSKDYDLYLKKKTKYEDEKAKVFAIKLSHCDEPMKNKVESHAQYATMEQGSDVTILLETIKEIAFDSNEKQYPARLAAIAWKQLHFVTSKRTKHLCCFTTGSLKQWIGRNICMARLFPRSWWTMTRARTKLMRSD
jgi:beta-galactosidase beta subunit